MASSIAAMRSFPVIVQRNIAPDGHPPDIALITSSNHIA
jgi:hypothetical protein